MNYVILEYLDDDPLLDNEAALQNFGTKKDVRAAMRRIAAESPHRYDWRYHICVHKTTYKNPNSDADIEDMRSEIVMIYHKGKIAEFRNYEEVGEWFQKRIECGDFEKSD